MKMKFSMSFYVGGQLLQCQGFHPCYSDSESFKRLQRLLPTTVGIEDPEDVVLVPPEFPMLTRTN